MDTRDFLRALRAHWLGTLGFFVLGLVLAGGVTAIQPKTYSAQASGIVATTSTSQDTGTSLAGNQLAQSKVKSYVDIGSWRTVAQYAIAQLHLDETPEALVGQVEVTNPVNTVILQVTATASTPEGARDLAQAWLQGIVRQVAQVEGAGGGTPAVKVIAGDSARLPSSPSSPDWRLNLLIGAAGGLAAGIAYAAVRDRSDRRIRSASDVQAATGEAVVGALPLESSLSRNPRLLPVDGSGDKDLAILGEAFRSLRTNLQYMSVDDPPRSIVMTSSAPSDGKSFTAANLAITLAAARQDVVLIDGDMRRPGLAELFGLVGDAGLSDVLAGRAVAQDVMQPVYGSSHLHVLTSGPIPPNPSEILGSARMRDLIASLSRNSLVIIDAPPLLAVTDSAILSRCTDGVLLVVRTGSTTDEMLTLAAQSISAVKGRILGVILNRVPTKGSGKVYYGYRYTGKYYRDSDGHEPSSQPEDRSGEDPLYRRPGPGAPVAAASADEADVATSEIPMITGAESAGGRSRPLRRPRRSSDD